MHVATPQYHLVLLLFESASYDKLIYILLSLLYSDYIMVGRASNPPACRRPAGVTTSGRPAARGVAIGSTKCSYECPGRVAELLFCGNSECASSIDKGVHLECEHSFADR